MARSRQIRFFIWISLYIGTLLNISVRSEIGSVNIGLRSQLYRCIQGPTSRSRSLHQSVTEQLRCVQSSIHRCSLFHAPRQREHLEMRTLCGVVNTGEQLRPHAWVISVAAKFRLYMDFLHFHLPSSPGCDYSAHLTVDSWERRKANSKRKRLVFGARYCGYRTPWHFGLLTASATIQLKAGLNTRPIPAGYYFVLAYYAFDADVPSVYVRHLYERLGNNPPLKSLMINLYHVDKIFDLEFQYHIQVKLMNRIRVGYNASLAVEVYDGPGPLSSLAQDSEKSKLTSNYQCFIKFSLLTNHRILTRYNNRHYARQLKLVWGGEKLNLKQCKNNTRHLYRTKYGPCIIYEAFKLIRINRLQFSGYNMLEHNPSNETCQYGGLFIITKDPKSFANYYEFTRICSNIMQEVIFPYAEYPFATGRYQGYVMFMTFPGYSEGFIDLEISDNPPNKDRITTNIVTSFLPTAQTSYLSIFKDTPASNVNRGTFAVNLWLVTGLHVGPPQPFVNYVFYYSSTRKHIFPSGAFKKKLSRGFILQDDVYFAVSVVNYGVGTVEFPLMFLPFSGLEYTINSSGMMHFNVTYSGYDRFPVFALNIQFIQESYYLCLPRQGYAVHEIDWKADKPLNLQVPYAWPQEQFAQLQSSWNYRSGGCRASILSLPHRSCTNCKASNLSNSSCTNHKLAQIHYRPYPGFTKEVELDVSLKKTPTCSLQCSLNIQVREHLQNLNASRHHEWRNIYRLTWQMVKASNRDFVVEIYASCDGICAPLCDVEVAISLPLTSNKPHDTHKAMYLKYVDYIKNDTDKLHGAFGLFKPVMKAEDHVPMSEITLGSWEDAHEYCLRRNASLFPLMRTLHGRLQDFANHPVENLAWKHTAEYFFADVRYDDNSSVWRSSDESGVPYVDWGLTHLPQHAAHRSCPQCPRNAHSPTIPKEANNSDPRHCAALEISADFSHVSAFPVDCATKYWSRILCYQTPSNSTGDFPTILENKGEFQLSKGSLIQNKDMCPAGFVFSLAKLCMKLTLVEQFTYVGDQNFILCDKSDTQRRCNKMNGDLMESRTLQETLLYYGHTQTSMYYVILDVLEEFYAEGADIYCNSDEESIWEKYGDADEMPNPPSYPSYLPCFSSRVPTKQSESMSIRLQSCDDGSMIPAVLFCDGKHDCPGGEDELQCSQDTCSMFQYQCNSGACVHYDHLCDDVPHCPSGDDEAFCQNKRIFAPFSVEAFSIPDLCNPPTGDLLMCRTTLQCYPSSAICHYDHSDGEIAYCKDGSHMGWGTFCEYVDCQGHYKCQGSYCIPVRKVCDGVVDCPIGDDEHDCTAYTCPGLLRCSGESFCLHPKELCDGVAHCPLQDDEKYCQLCPKECTCSGTMIYCNSIAPYQNTTALYPPSALILRNVNALLPLLNYMKMDHLRLFDLRHGSIASIPDNELSFFKAFNSVKYIFVNNVGLSILPPYFIHGANAIYANFSHNKIHLIEVDAFKMMKNTKVLSLASNSLQTMESHFCKELEYLTDLYLTDNPLISIAHSGFLENPGLKLIRSSWYIVCCLASHVEDCRPQNQFISSCADLISSLVQRVLILTESIVIILGNIGAMIIQVLSRDDTRLLTMNLALADVLMGGYLLAIASVDVTYSGVFYTIVQSWPGDIACLMFGLLNFTSSQVSLLVLCILSVARMVSIDKIGGMAYNKSKIWKACFAAWILATTAGGTYTLMLYSRGQGARNNLCITIGISAHYSLISVFELIFQALFIFCNLCVLSVILSSMVYIFHLVAKSMHSVQQARNGDRRHACLIKLGRRLLLLLTCNVLSWLPFMVVSILVLLGVSVHEYIVQWIAILGVPLCAFTDPFLYSIAPLRTTLLKRMTKLRVKVI